jgi:hypothetical protein
MSYRYHHPPDPDSSLRILTAHYGKFDIHGYVHFGKIYIKLKVQLDV